VALMVRSPSEKPVPASTQRIVSLAPNVTEILFAIGAGESVVGVTRFCNAPDAARDLPKVGGYIDPNLEAILALEPTLVVGVEEAINGGVQARLEELKVPVLVVDTRTMEGLSSAVKLLSKVVSDPEEGRVLNAKIQATFEEVAQRTSSGVRPRVLMVVGHQPLVVAGGGVFMDELIHAAGGVNVAGKTDQEYPVWSIEHVIRAAPDVIVLATMGGEAPLAWEDFDMIPAVRDGRVKEVPDMEMLLRPGPRIGAGLLWLAGVIHPGIFPKE
jgi:iron complex transport system substrate-binding protein